MTEIELGFFDHLILFLLGVVLPSVAVFHSQPEMKVMEFDTAAKKQVYYGNSIFQWVCAGAVMLVWVFSKRNFESFGFGMPELHPIAIGLLLLFCLLYGLDVWWELRNMEQVVETKKRWQADVPFLPTNSEELRHFSFVALTAGVCEEIIFRGFFIQYFLSINKDNLLGTWLSIVIPAFLFAFGHLYQGGKAVAKTMVMAILFGWIYVLTKSLWLLIIIHFLVDLIGGYLAMKVLKETTPNMDSQEQ